MHAISQIIERNLFRRAPCDSACWINPEKDSCWTIASSDCTSMKLFSQDYSNCLFHRQAGAEVEFGAFPESTGKKYDWLILNLPRQKALLQMMLDCAADLLAENGVLWLAGENRAGIKSAEKHLKIHFGRVTKLDNARHCSLYEASGVLHSGAFRTENYRQQWPLECRDAHLDIISYPGVFAHGRLDPGTALMLESLVDMKLEGEVLDFACGAGVIGACIATRHTHANVTLLENSALALKASEETIVENGLAGSILASDGFSDVVQNYDVIVSNPPIHAGVRTDSQMGMRLLEPAYRHLNPGGKLILVANVHLPYERWLSQLFGRSKELLADEHYKLVMADKRTA